jgi:hypothetical protein
MRGLTILVTILTTYFCPKFVMKLYEAAKTVAISKLKIIEKERPSSQMK